MIIIPRIFVTSDTHGMKAQLQDCLDKAEFDRKIDTLIHLGDCVDRGPDSKGVIDLLISIPNKICIRGNHDQVFVDWMKTGVHKFHWLEGGRYTIDSYVGGETKTFTNLDVPKDHKEFFKSQVLHYTDEKNRFFVHGGFSRHKLISEEKDPTVFYWDRDLYYAARSISEMRSESKITLKDKNGFSRIFVGHTDSTNWKDDSGKPITVPLYAGQLVGVDTGSCFGGKLSLIDITNDEDHILYQS